VSNSEQTQFYVDLTVFIPTSVYLKGFNMNEASSQPWYQLYASAIVELDAKQLIERVTATEAAIDGRLHDLRFDSDHHEERILMDDAQLTLAFLRRHP